MDDPRKMKHMVSPLWIIQLWVNAILANNITLKRNILDDIELKIEGAQSKEFCTYECYSKYISRLFFNSSILIVT